MAPPFRDNLQQLVGDLLRRVRRLEAVAVVDRVRVQIEVSQPGQPIDAASDVAEFFITPDLDGWYLTDARAAFTSAVGATIDSDAFIWNETQSVQMLSGALTIAVGDTCSPIASVEGLTTTTQLVSCDVLQVYLDPVDAAAQGWSVWMEFSRLLPAA